jgi:hypothetical protein
MMVVEKKQLCLRGKEAIKLWKSGREEWNKWVSENPESGVSFREADFSKFRTEENSGVLFKGFIFPNGYVNFNRATFGDGDVDFSFVKFGDGDVSFDEVTFGDGDVSFSAAKFGNGLVKFRGAIFGDGDVDFSFVMFGDGDVSFHQAIFGDGDVDFSVAKFGDGRVDFSVVLFGNGSVQFNRATFGDGNVSFGSAKFSHALGFFNAKFGDGHIDFSYVKFGDGGVSFNGARFGYCEMDFGNATFGGGNVDFGNAIFKGAFVMDECINTEAIKSFSFKNTQFDNAVTLENLTLTCVLDLTNTSFKNQINLDGLTCQLSRSKKKCGFSIADNIKDISRFRRLKEICENNKAHKLALTFQADEHRAQRWHKMGIFESLLDWLFSGVCTYGQSIWRPSYILVLSIVLFTVPYTVQSDSLKLGTNLNSELIIFSAANSIPFLTSARSARENGIRLLFEGQGQDSLSWVYATMMAQGTVSVILLFLIGLGLRNRFRM